MARPFLSKSRYLAGLQCLKYLWLQANDPEKVPKPDAMTQHVFDQGHIVEELARSLFKDGTEVAFEDFQANLRLTRTLLKERRTLFQAGIMVGNIYSRLDVLRPAADGTWDIIEIKSSTKAKDENLDDLAFQRHCCQQHGLSVGRCRLVHINNKYVRRGEPDPEKLFAIEDVTEAVEKAATGISERINMMLDVIKSRDCPEKRPGTHCRSPYECGVTACVESLPDNNVLHLYRGGAKSYDLLYDGIRYLRDIPESVKLTEAQEIQRKCDANSCEHIDSESIRSFMAALEYPVYYLDFETFNTAVPLFDGTRPYQNIPFQFSVHVVDRPGSMPLPYAFLAEGAEDPRPALLAALRDSLGDRGSVVVYNKSFEDGVLEDLGEAFGEYRAWTDAVRARLVDLLVPFRRFHYYHPDQKGSASIKSVLPALTGSGYEGMDIGKGDEASLAYLAMCHGTMTEAQKRKTRADLVKYCALDTEAMIRIIRRLGEVAGVAPATDSGPKKRKRPR